MRKNSRNFTIQPVVIITGASRGLGRAIALAFGKRQYRVVVNYRLSDKDAQEVVNEIISSGGDAIGLQADVGDVKEVRLMTKEVMKKWGRIDVLVNNAGITRDNLLVKVSEDDWDAVLKTNLKGAFNTIREVARVMMKHGGHIINIGSASGIRGRAGQSSYAASKAGLIGITKSAAVELGRFNIRVNAVLPGVLPTDMMKGSHPSVKEKAKSESVIGRLSDIEQIAEFIYNLAEMNNVSGQIFNLDSRII